MDHCEAKVQLYIASSLDGFIATSDGSVEWLNPYFSAEFGYDAFYAGVGSLVMGRATYEQVCGFGDWAFTGKRTVVLSRSTSFPEPISPDISFYNGALPALCAELKRSAPGNIWLMGGGEVIRSFLQAERVDEILLFVMPVLLGTGVPLFLDTGRQITLALKQVERFENGAALLHYAQR